MGTKLVHQSLLDRSFRNVSVSESENTIWKDESNDATRLHEIKFRVTHSAAWKLRQGLLPPFGEVVMDTKFEGHSLEYFTQLLVHFPVRLSSKLAEDPDFKTVYPLTFWFNRTLIWEEKMTFLPA